MKLDVPRAIKIFYLNQLNIGNARRSHRDIFTGVYRNNAWRGQESVSGPGSSVVFTQSLIQELPHLFDRHGIRSILDAPCGDFNWMKHVDLNQIDSYTGVDVVPQLIETNAQIYSDGNRRFETRDITQDRLPTSDLIICRDCLFHFSFKDIFSTLRNFAATGSAFLLTTTHTDHQGNRDIFTGGFRLINLEQSPFSFPEALEYLPDRGHYPKGHKQYQRHLGLWRIRDLNI